MTTAQELLQMIEAVDPNDTEKLDEIDARVMIYLRGHKFIRIDKIYNRIDYKTVMGHHYSSCLKPKEGSKYRYTRSRDALKNIRPGAFGIEALRVAVNLRCTVMAFYYSFDGVKNNFSSCGLTEELTELHAIIQAIEFERNKA